MGAITVLSRGHVTLDLEERDGGYLLKLEGAASGPDHVHEGDCKAYMVGKGLSREDLLRLARNLTALAEGRL